MKQFQSRKIVLLTAAACGLVMSVSVYIIFQLKSEFFCLKFLKPKNPESDFRWRSVKSRALVCSTLDMGPPFLIFPPVKSANHKIQFDHHSRA
jgi:hypothetical protein